MYKHVVENAKSPISNARVLVVVAWGIIFHMMFLASFNSYATEEISVSGNSLRIAFTGHTYPLMQGDLQYYLADKINEHHPDLVVVAGDVVPGCAGKTQDPVTPVYEPNVFSQRHLRHTICSHSLDEEQWDKHDLFLKRLSSPVLFVPGNHDFYAREGIEFVAKRSPTKSIYFARRADGFLFVFLRTSDITDAQHSYQLDSAQLAWLQELLKKEDPSSKVFLFMHHQLWDIDYYSDFQPKGDPEQFSLQVLPLLSRFPMAYVFSGDGQIKPNRVRNDENISYFAMSNLRTRIGFYLIELDIDSKKVSVQPVIEYPSPIQSNQRPASESTLWHRISGVFTAKKFWLGVFLGGVAGLAMYWFVHRKKRNQP